MLACEYKYQDLTLSISISILRSPITSSTSMYSMKQIFVALAALCLATAVASDPAKPNPPTEFTMSAFALTDSGYTSARVYYDQTNQRYVSIEFITVAEFILIGYPY